MVLVIQQSEIVAQQSSLDAQAADVDTVVVHGVVTQRKKYSIIVQSGQQQYEVKLPSTVPIARELIRPKFDFLNSQVQITLPCTGVGGDQSKNEVVDLALPNPTYLVASFKTPENRKAFQSGRTKTIGSFTLFKKPQTIDDDRKLAGVLESSSDGYSLVIGSSRLSVELGTKVNLLSGFTILDLEEGVEVTLKADRVDDQWIAQRIQFQKRGTVVAAEDKPRMLSLGDMVSFSYQRALHDQFGEQYQVIHPPANCGGSENWKLVNRWLGPYSTRRWDVILFNVGMLDSNLGKEAYQSNLRKWLEAIQPAGVKVVWLTTTPVQGATGGQGTDELVGKVPGRMKLQNQWAAEVLSDYPAVVTCDLWQIVADGRETDFQEWWQKSRPQFNFRQSKKLAAAIAETLESSTNNNQ